MKEILTIIWTFLLGNIVSYIGGALTGGTYDFTQTAIVTVVLGIIISFIPKILPKHSETDTKTTKS